MNAKKRRRLYFAAAILIAAGGATALILGALKENIELFKSPSDLKTEPLAAGVTFRVGGLVEDKSLHHGKGTDISFVITDGKNQVPVEYNGVLPALFREGQGVIALGSLNGAGVFVAQPDGILAKHDEKYMPPEVVQALKKSGHWKEGEQ
jgi:cytochrome c-type biogenesis protein CcmE